MSQNSSSARKQARPANPTDPASTKYRFCVSGTDAPVGFGKVTLDSLKREVSAR